MMSAVTWSIASMSCLQSPTPDYVANVMWAVTATESGQSFFMTGQTSFPVVQQSNYIPYNQLTPEIVLGWVKEKLGPETVANCEKSVTTQLGYQLNPPVEPQPQPLPW
jgi:hypothetical protein